ncbi:M23 family metallopeptidase [Namhaeicola litoreus]|uniref:M23 family metallopeptidase n=1 Tax=Namhaeicola litoreus TaxID=1052145 RepID=A0ABW3Y0M3_9FLAO
MDKPKSKSKIKEKLTFKYRFVVLNEDTFEERFSFRLNRLSAFVFGSLFSIFLIVITTALIAFTPLKEYIPGYSSSKLKKDAATLNYKVDSLSQLLNYNNLFIENFQQVLKGEIAPDDFNKDSLIQVLSIDEVDLAPSELDSSFRAEIEREERFNVFEAATKRTDVIFTSPVKGRVTDRYNPKEKHFAVDIALDKDTPVKSIADGTVIFKGFTADTGYVIIIEHVNGIISVYKHNSTILKNQGDLVKAGEAVAIAGSTGELSTATHLHFELWEGGYTVNPENYIDFE